MLTKAAVQPRLGLGHRNDAASKPGAAQLFGQMEDVEKKQPVRGMAEEAAQNFATAVIADEDVQGRVVAWTKPGSVVRRQPSTDHRVRQRIAGFR